MEVATGTQIGGIEEGWVENFFKFDKQGKK